MRKFLLIILTVLTVFGLYACIYAETTGNTKNNGDDPAINFMAVSSIKGFPDAGIINVPLTLTGTVEPSDATNQDIGWTIEINGTTNSVLNGNILTAAAAGRVLITAAIENGSSVTTPFSVSFYITITEPVPFYPVTGITGVPTQGITEQPLTLSGTVTPVNATNKPIIWSVKEQGNTGAEIDDNILTTAAAGTVIVTATIINGLTDSTPYIKDFSIIIKDPDPEPDPNYISAMEFAASMKIGWNLGNTLDGHSSMTPNETSWQSVRTTQALMDYVKDQGFGLVRIPVTWGTMLHSQLRNNPGSITLTEEEIQVLTINQTWLNRVAEVVDYAKNAGMKAIINIHHDGADSSYWLSVKNADLTGSNRDKVNAIIVTLWTQIAKKFIDEGDYLIFEGFNELHDGSWSDGSTAQRNRINELNQIFVTAVRAVGGENTNRFLLIHGWVTRPSVTVSNLVMPYDSAHDRLMVGFHFYDPYDFTGSANWNTWGDKARPGNWANEANVRNTFNNVKNKFINNGIPVIMGEYGAVRQNSVTGKAHRLYYMEYVTKHAVDCGFVPVYWDNGSTSTGTGGSEQFGLFNRSNRTYANDAQDIVNVLMKAAYESYPLSSIIVP